jgi:hypothetical protein
VVIKILGFSRIKLNVYLFIAANECPLDLIREIVEKGAEIDHQDNDGCTALILG